MILMATGDVLVYFMPKNGQELNNIANPHWAAPGLHDRDKAPFTGTCGRTAPKQHQNMVRVALSTRRKRDIYA